MAVDQNGGPLRIEVTSGYVHDSQVMDVILDRETLVTVLDKAAA